MPLHPTVAFIGSQMSEAMPIPMTSVAIDTLRRGVSTTVVPSTIEVSSVTDSTVSGVGGAIPVRIYRDAPAEQPTGTLVWQHGGGFAMGDLEMSDDICRRFAKETGQTVVSVDYRLAPEHPFPAGLHDCRDVARWVATEPTELGPSAGWFALGGDSAGGTLALLTAMMLRDAGEAEPACVLSVYGTASMEITNPEFGDLPFLAKADADWFWNAYSDGKDLAGTRYYEPASTLSDSGLCPVLTITAENDPTRDGSEAFAATLQSRGIDAPCIRFAGMHHGFFGLVDVLSEARLAFSAAESFLAKHGRETAAA